MAAAAAAAAVVDAGESSAAASGSGASAAVASPGPAPVTVLTGFLGAGKTTRLNATLAAGLERIAVIENELGALGVDGAMVANTHDDGVIELTNGCLCCSGEVDLVAALEGLARRRATRPFDRVIIETTGLADVAPVVALLQDRDDPLFQDFAFDAVVTVVDVAALHRWVGAEGAGPPIAWASGFGAGASASAADDGAGGGGGGGSGASHAGAAMGGVGREAARSAFWKQVAMADQVIVSKADLVSEEVLLQARAAVVAANPLVEEAIVHDGGPSTPLPPPLRNGNGGRCVPPAPSPAAAFAAAFAGAGAGQKRRRGAPHLEGVQAFTLHLPSDRPLRSEPLQVLARELLAGSWSGRSTDWGEAWRVKGFVLVEGEGPMLLQGVGDQLSLEPWVYSFEGLRPFLVVIGEGLRREMLEAALEACASDCAQPRLGAAGDGGGDGGAS